jgi:AraC-like DNA-binding protein
MTVRRYAAGQRQAAHTDRHSRVSLLLRGALCEESRAGALRLGPGDVLLKSHEVEHEDRFGDDGAVILSLAFTRDDPFDQGAPPWRKRDDGAGLRLAASLIEAAAANDRLAVDAIGTDLVAGGADHRYEAGRAPAWLLRLRDELEGASLATVDVAARARKAGVHAAHASRLFRRCFGASITEHAQQHAVRRAMALMAPPETALSDVALAAGFYDQSHMIRVFRRMSGRPPGALRAMTARLAALCG